MQKINAALVELSINVSTSDRHEAKEKFSEFTIVRYLKGRGTDLDTGVALLEFFRRRIEDREKVIGESAGENSAVA